MSPIASLSPTSTAFPAINTHTRGHKHGWQMGSADSPTGALQNLFGSLLQTAEKVVGLQSGVASAAAAANVGAKSAGTIATHSANSLLQNYLNNLSHKQQPNGLQAPTSAGTTINTDA
jgi:hypothetical protein